MSCVFMCGKGDHNKRGHGKYIERQMQEPEVEVDDEFACPEILQVNALKSFLNALNSFF